MHLQMGYDPNVYAYHEDVPTADVKDKLDASTGMTRCRRAEARNGSRDLVM